MSEPTRKFRARRDAVHLLLVLAILGMGGFMVSRPDLVLLPMGDKLGWLLLVFGVLACWDFVVTSYEITPAELIIRGGFSSQNIPLDTVYTIYLKSGWVLHRRVCVKYHVPGGTASITLFPRDANGLLRRFFQYAPWLIARN